MKGFTLIGLSIVLVIIAIITVGVAGGKHLVHVAELQSIIKEATSLKSSIFAFKLEYRAFPGDIGKASTYWPGAADGNNDGLINTATIYPVSGESLALWNHLTLAGIVKGNYSGSVAGSLILGNFKNDAAPASNYISTIFPISEAFALPPQPPSSNASFPISIIIGSGYWAEFQSDVYDRRGNILWLSSKVDRTLVGNAIIAKDARSIDLKIDDGLADNGEVYAINGTNSNKTISTNCTTAAPTATPPSNYIKDSVSASCRLGFWIDDERR